MNTSIVISTVGQNVDTFLGREWLITNGLGGYASGTLAGIISRRYHGLFLPNLAEPKGRHLLISRFDERVQIADRNILISGGEPQPSYQGDARLESLQSVTVSGNTVSWIYRLSDVVLEKTIVMPHLQNTVQVRYRLLQGHALSMQLRPFLPFRRQDAELISHGDLHFATTRVGEGIEVHCRESNLYLRMIASPSAAFINANEETTAQLLERERIRGNPHYESLSSPGYFSVELTDSVAVAFVATVNTWQNIEFNIDAVLNAEGNRVNVLLQPASANQDEFVARLYLAADQFLIRPASRPEDATRAHNEGHLLRTVIAGYHWFGDWGRDTMISLEGLMLCTGRFGEARATLLTFAQYVRDGLLPNLFPEGKSEGLYHTVDASLWYFHAIHRYVVHTADQSVLQQLLPVLRSIIAHHIAGTRFGIRVDPESDLIVASSDRHALTWMDAHMGDWIVTPRRGKPVEIQALWYNALRLMAQWESSATGDTNDYENRAARVYQSFNKYFWNPENHGLFDVVDGDNGNDSSIRPNQVFAMSLQYPVLAKEHWNDVLALVRDHLLTPFGLRTLSRDNPAYRATYSGNLATRDAAYHQGTVWPWLIGHFIDAWLRVYPDPTTAREMLAAFPDHLKEAGIGTVSEVFDAQFPHVPHGCIAQAWSVAEILRAWQRTSASL